MRERARSLVAPALASLVGIAVLVGLGVWQLRRLAWKEALIAAVESRVHAAPVDLPSEADWSRFEPADAEYRHVRVAGVYDGSRQALVFRALGSPRGRYGGPGYLVMTPLRLANGAVVLVNRGFVPQDRKDQAASRGLGAGETLVTGLMRASEERTWFTPADNPASGQWFTRDVEAMARAMGLSRYAPFSIDADASADPADLPEGGETIVAFPNSHLSYAMTWFGMALALASVFGAYAVTQLRAGEKNEGRPAPVGDGDGGR
ncbi:MAG TPA: SURF1 family protein [Roseiarcus sp.]|nr:SURF1 family protein [Roseiarcus sp.]